jgi:inhibitor of KinA sporulation pathway (predicted exonuclease)
MEDKENTHKTPIEIFTSLDLEMNQPSRKIIQIGACAGNIRTGEILEKLSIFVNPQEQLAPFIIELTGIKQEDVDTGLTIYEGYKKLAEFHKKHKSFVNPITWGGGDSQEIYEQLKKECGHVWGLDDHWCFGRRWIDTKTLFVSWRFANGKPIQGGLAKSMLKVGLKFEGRKHNATDDAVNTFRTYTKMLDLLKSKDSTSV